MVKDDRRRRHGRSDGAGRDRSGAAVFSTHGCATWLATGCSTRRAGPQRRGEKIVADTYVRQIQTSGRKEIYLGRELTTKAFPNDPPISNAWQWDAIWPDGDMSKGGFFGQGLYVSPAKDLVVAYFSTVLDTALHRYARQIATDLGPAAPA